MSARDPDRRGLPFDVWPEADRLAWQSLLEPGDIFDDGGEGAQWAPSTRIAIVQSYGHWLAWLQRAQPATLLRAPAERVTPEAVAAYIELLGGRVAPLTIRLRVQHLAAVVVPLALTQDWGWLRRVIRRLDRRAIPARQKHDRLIGAEAIFSESVAMMMEADGLQAPDWRRAELYRDGLMLAVLVSRPLRLRNFSAIEVGQHLVRRGPGFELRFEGTETKIGQEIEAQIPDTVAPLLDRYLRVHRPVLRRRAKVSAPTDGLWISRNGTKMEKASVYCRIVTLTERELGVRINPHMFRDCVATSIALEDPEHVRITRHILGHSTLRTSERHYNHANSVQAARRYQDHVLSLRRQAPLQNGTSDGTPAEG